jgi:hypothetical protein
MSVAWRMDKRCAAKDEARVQSAFPTPLKLLANLTTFFQTSKYARPVRRFLTFLTVGVRWAWNGRGNSCVRFAGDNVWEFVPKPAFRCGGR